MTIDKSTRDMGIRGVLQLRKEKACKIADVQTWLKRVSEIDYELASLTDSLVMDEISAKLEDYDNRGT